MRQELGEEGANGCHGEGGVFVERGPTGRVGMLWFVSVGESSDFAMI